MRPPMPRRGLARCPPPATTATMGLQRQAGDNSPYCAREAPAVAEPRLRPAQVLVHDSLRPASVDAVIFRPARWRRRPHRKTHAPNPVSNSATRPRPPGAPTARWAARSRGAPASAPPDGDDGTPGRGRLCPASGGVDHWPHSRPLWLSMTGIVQGEEKEEPRRGAGEAARAAVARGWGGVAMRSPLRPRRGAAILAEGVREIHWK